MPYSVNKTVLSYAQNLMAGRVRNVTVGSVILPREGCHCMYKNLPLPQDGNMTKLCDIIAHHHENEGKSFHLVKSLYQNSVHASSLLPTHGTLDYRSYPQKSHCYLAHLTPTRRKRKKKCRI